jgi:hypothetical protein
MTTHIELVNAKTVRISTACPNTALAGKCGRIAEWAPVDGNMHYLVYINGARGTFVHGKYLSAVDHCRVAG